MGLHRLEKAHFNSKQELEYRHKQGTGEQDRQKRKRAIEPFHLPTKHILFLKAAMMKEAAVKKLKRCHRF